MDLAELADHILNFVNKAGPVVGKLEVAAVADAVQRAAQDGAAGLQPVGAGLTDRVAALGEHIGEEVGQQTALGVADTFDVGDHPQRNAAADRADHGVQADGGKILAVGLGADPVIAEEHHRLFAVGVDDIDHLLGQLADLLLLELDKVAEFLARHAEHCVVVALIHNELRAELVAGPLLELFQNVGADAGAVTEPLDEFLAFLVVKGQRELVEEGRKPHHINVGVSLAPAAQLFFYIRLRLGLAHIVGQLVRRVLPVVGQEVVHVYGVPDQKRQKADGILVVGNRLNFNLTGRLVKEPLVGGYDLAGRAVDDLPPALGVVQRVDLELLGVETVHQMDAQLRAARRVAVADEILLLDLIGVCLGPGVILAGRIIGSVFLCRVLQKLCRHLGAIAVAQGVSPQQVLQTQGFLHHICVCGKCQSSKLLHVPVPFRSAVGRQCFIDNIIPVSCGLEQTISCCAFALSCYTCLFCGQHSATAKILYKSLTFFLCNLLFLPSV